MTSSRPAVALAAAALLALAPLHIGGCGSVLCVDGYAEVHVCGRLLDSATGEPLAGVPLEANFPASGWRAVGETTGDGTFVLVEGRMYGGCFYESLLASRGARPPEFPAAGKPMTLIVRPDVPDCRQEFILGLDSASVTLTDLLPAGREVRFASPLLADACTDQ